MQIFRLSLLLFIVMAFAFSTVQAQDAARSNDAARTLKGYVVTARNEVVVGAQISVADGGQTVSTQTDGEGRFWLRVKSADDLQLRVFGKGLALKTVDVAAAQAEGDLRVEVEYVIPPIHESLVIRADALEPAVEQRNGVIYDRTLFARDDQLLQTLNAGINAGQHEGGGKSLEIRRFGFNLDHGGVNGGLKILVDNIQQNQGTQGHGQGYLGALKSLSPELVEGVEILNGPFSAQYGDFSGLGVVQIRTRETLEQVFTARIQGGSFDLLRGFFAYSPKLKNGAAFIAYEPSFSQGPFLNPLQYRRDNITGNYRYDLRDKQSIGFKFNFGRNRFTSSGQIPLDEVFAGRLDRFGFIDPDNGGRVRLGTASVYYRKEYANGAAFKADAFLGRSLFDLFSNFTFFLTDPIYGDEIQQHDSRLQEGGNAQYLLPYHLFGQQALLNIGGNIHANQINVGLYPTIGRNPIRKFTPENINNPDILLTDARAKVNNYAGYVQHGLELLDGHLHIETGLRFDYFRFRVNDILDPINSGVRTTGRWQPKLAAAYTPSHKLPITLYGNYGRGISSQDARGVVRDSDAPAVAITDFYQAGFAYNHAWLSFSGSGFLINRSNEQVYIPDDGSIEFSDPSRVNGYEARSSIRVNRYLAFNAGLTQVTNAYFRGTSPRVYVDSAPHTVANGNFVLTDYRGFFGALNYRHTSNYRLDGERAEIRASGLDVVDFALTKNLRRWVAVNFAVDNVLGKRYFETQNYFESRIAPDADVIERIHATPGYPRTFTAGVTFRLVQKN